MLKLNLKREEALRCLSLYEERLLAYIGSAMSRDLIDTIRCDLSWTQKQMQFEDPKNPVWNVPIDVEFDEDNGLIDIIVNNRQKIVFKDDREFEDI
jgi:hypothetical protein